MNNTVKRFIIALLIAVGLVAAPAIASTASAAPVAPRVTYNSATDCNQSAFLGARVCFDDTTGYGPVGYVYTDAYTVYAAEGSINSCSANGIGAFIGTPYEATVGSDYTALVMATFDGNTQPFPCNGGYFKFSVGFHDILEWVVNCRCGYEYVHVN